MHERLIGEFRYRLNPNAYRKRLLDVVSKDWQENYYDTVMDPRVEEAILTVPRHRFTSSFPLSRIYNNSILPHEGHNDSTASEPGLVAYMTQLVLPEGEIPHDSIALDIGCGLGYQTAMLKAVGFSRVIGVEIKPDIAQKAQRIFKDDSGVAIVGGDGKNVGDGLKFDAIVVAALADSLPTVNVLSDKLKDGGKIVIPISKNALFIKPEPQGEEKARVTPKDNTEGFLFSAVKTNDTISWKSHGGVTFVNLV